MKPLLEKPRASIGVAATGMRPAAEFRIAIESMVDSMRSCYEGRIGPVDYPVQDLGSNLATHQEPILSSNSPRSLPSCHSSLGRLSQSCIFNS